jgi:hypothetical protein
MTIKEVDLAPSYRQVLRSIHASNLFDEADTSLEFGAHMWKEIPALSLINL